MSLIKVLKKYRWHYLDKDLSAGLLVATLTIPLAIGYAQVAGIPPIYGLYTAIFSVIGYLFFASSPDLIVGLDSTISGMLGSILIFSGFTAQSNEAISFVIVISLLSGIFLIAFSFLKLGKFIKYLSTTVMNGFISGVALSILISQIPKILSLVAEKNDALSNLWIAFSHLSQINWLGFILAILTIIFLLFMQKKAPKFPSALVILIFITILSFWLNLDQYGLQVVGSIPQGLPKFHFPDFSLFNFSILIGTSLMIAVIIFADSLLVVNNFARKNRYSVNDNQELKALGIGNAIGSFFGGTPISASVSRTAANNAIGGKTQVAQLFSAICILIVVLFFSQSLYYLPQTVLAAIVFTAVLKIIDLKPLARFIRQKNYSELTIWLVAVFGVIFTGATFGVLVAVLLSFGDFIRKSASPPQAFLGVIPRKTGYYDLSRHKGSRAIPGVVIYRFSSPLFFGNIDHFISSLKPFLSLETPPKMIIIQASGIGNIDYSAQKQLQDLLKDLQASKIKYYFVGLIGPVKDQISKSMLSEYISKADMYQTIGDVLKFKLPSSKKS